MGNVIRYLLIFLFSYCTAQTFNIDHDYKGFDDSILFSMKWIGLDEYANDKPKGERTRPEIKVKESLHVKTTNNEDYKCNIPELIVKESPRIENYHGPSPLATLRPLFSQKVCSYRLESYWSYEVCHGRYVRQYHEEREGKQVKSQQYYLGRLNSDKQKKLEDKMLDMDYVKNKPSYTKIDGVPMPYVEMVLADGTQCELVGKPRMTRILYVCYSHAKHEIYSFKETSTCEYEIVVLSPLLCTHPLFMPKSTSENVIECISDSNAAKVKPVNLMILEDHMKTLPDGETHLMIELLPLEEPTMESLTSTHAKKLPQKLSTPAPIADDSPVRAFLNGDECLTGGSGWWKYEFCYGKHVKQYHEDRNGQRTVVRLGTFNEEAHKTWILENRAKAPAPLGTRTSISHFYSNGDYCEKTGRPRQTEVKLKCVDSSKSQVTIYLLEPKTCNYILGVESPIICEILPLADSVGLVTPPKSKSGIQPEFSGRHLEDPEQMNQFVREINNDIND